MKIWITRSSAFSIQCGGLERLFVWFRKPVWVAEWRDASSYDSPFDDPTDLVGKRVANWEVRESNSSWISTSLSFGKMFGYGDRKEEGENEIAKYVWSKLEEHFKNEPFDDWHEVEKRGDAKKQDFILEIEINIKLGSV
jgi:hypothetical protein